MLHEYRFNAFGRLLAVVRSNGRWNVFDLGTDGKRRPANLHIPPALAADELAQYLGDLLHENASPKCSGVVPVPLPRRV
ncbi:hypothetical protein KDW55_04170 [Burkholderia sp. AU19243]|uniref:DUF7661 domain-containing protein n=1 Tax=Burkholderia latens TaxID=488446 RepID=A0AAP1G8X1_9BURK|nr:MULTISPECIES: hypothetical protein [Burkholderia]AIO38636.1 hypothetical protein DM40_4576 [Burkholderia cenocepacia]MBR7959870.1 hypothetical protein [Burkholderia vietnamiensis]AOK07784.1 hypothetical protein WK25_25315 [Burkholderia latens]KVA04792.1 hypothetical protein WI41_22225 [Burkholderia latens]MBR8144414.1 hypothetical protein [Burkholderia vietnamiensis]